MENGDKMSPNQSKRRSSSKPEEELKIARERIGILFVEAKKRIRSDKNLANRYVTLARRIGMRYNLSLPTEFRNFICNKCKKFMYPGITAKVSTSKGYIRKQCLQCEKVAKLKLKKA